MHPIINNLVQLQELHVARDQQKASQPDADLSGIDDAIAKTAAAIPEAILAQFNRLIARNPLAIVPLEQRDGKFYCTACGMALPVALAHQIHAVTNPKEVKDETLARPIACPSCARILFYRDSNASAHTVRKISRHAIGLERFSSETLMIPDLQGTTRDEVLKEFCALLKSEGFIDNEERLFKAAVDRESIVSTAMENAIAFPHVRCIEGGAISLALGISKNGVRFDPASDELTRIFFFMVIPTASSAYYLKLLSGLSTKFQDEKNRNRLLEAADAKDLWKNLLDLTGDFIR